MMKDRAMLVWKDIPGLEPSQRFTEPTNEEQWRNRWLSNCSASVFACASLAEKKRERDFAPTKAQLLKHPLAIVALVPRDAALFAAGAVSGAAAKTVTAPLDRIKLLMQQGPI